MAVTAVAQARLKEDELLYKKRHSLAHVMAEAVLELLPEAQIAIGPPVDNGFYYDFELPRSLKEEDLAGIETKMREILSSKATFDKEVVSKKAAAEVFRNQKYKIAILNDLPENEEISLYRSHHFVDLCRGPHVESMAQLDPHCFHLTRIAGAYWKADERNPQLQRVYALAFHDKTGLDEHLAFLEEAEKRDHRRLGTELDLFHLDPENPGQIFWHPHGWSLWRVIEDYVRIKVRHAGYQEVKTPFIMPQSLWERSGHWAKYREAMFVTESEKRLFALKPMNCPGHVEIFKQGLRSYRELPLRLAEFGSCTRNEATGALHGIMRIRGFVQDDAHIFCTEDQIEAEVKDFCDLLSEVYQDFGFAKHTIVVKLSLRPEMRLGDDATWDRAEAALGRACNAAGFEFAEMPGEGAFYGPKLEFTLIDALGRSWQCGTLQLDYQLPSADRLNATYIGEDGAKHHPVILHRAILGSLERFIGILIENYGGAFPLWLAPVQVTVATITSDADGFAEEAARKLRAAGLRVETDLRNEKINYKIREHSLAKVPVIAVVGRREAEEGKLALRRFGSEGQQIVTLEEAAAMLSTEALPPDLARAAKPA